MVMLVVDTSPRDGAEMSHADRETLMERVLSLAATAVHELSRNTVRVRLFVTGEQLHPSTADAQVHAPTDTESLLIRLASAKAVSVTQADQAIQAAIEQTTHCPVLILTARIDHPLCEDSAANVTALRVDPAEDTVTRSGTDRIHSLRPDRALEPAPVVPSRGGDGAQSPSMSDAR